MRSFLTRGIRAALAAMVPFTMLSNAHLQADEGMWLFNNLPRKQLQEKYGFSPTKEWVDNLMRSAVRISSGGSGSFISPEGLVLTNHHVGSDALQKLSTPQKNLLETGFTAKDRGEEL